MPFTPAHAAAAWPLRRAVPRLPLAALMVGCLSPDFEYLLRLAPNGWFGHTPLGLLVFCLPVSISVLALGRHLLWPAFVTLVPAGIAGALPPGRPRSSWGLQGSGILLGATSHVLWDVFTHREGFVVVQVEALRAELVPGLPCYQVLQHASTLAGLAVLSAWLGRWLRRQRAVCPGFPGRWPDRASAVAAVLLVAASAGALLNGARAIGGTWPRLVGMAAVGGMDGLAVTALGYSLWARASVKRTRRSAGSSIE